MSYGKGNNLSVDKEDIAKHVDQLTVWHWLLGFSVDYGDRFCNPFRPDKSPKCYLTKGYKWDFLSDYANRKFHSWTILHAVMHKFNCTFDEACNIVWTRFGDKSIEIEQFTPEKIQQIEAEEFKCNIHFQPHLYNGRPSYLPIDRDYWSPLYITSEQLVADYTYSIKMYKYNDKLGRKFQLYPTSQCYAFTFSSGNVKIYNPYREIGKWIANTDKFDIGFLDDLPATGDTLYICKSYKDCRIQRNMGFNAIWIQGEHFPIPDIILANLAKRFKKIYIFFDNDTSGIDACLNLVSYANGFLGRTQFYPLWLPKQLYSQGITDNAEYVLAHKVPSLKGLIKTLTDDTTNGSPVMASLSK